MVEKLKIKSIYDDFLSNVKLTDDTQKILQELEYHLRQQDEILEKQNKILNKLNGGK